MRGWKDWLFLAIRLGVGWSLVSSVFLSHFPLLKKLELSIQDELISFRSPKIIPQEILLIKIKERDLSRRGIIQELDFYADLVNKLIEHQASVVVLNLRYGWAQSLEFEKKEEPLQASNRKIRGLIDKYSERLVLVTRTIRQSENERVFLRIYNHFLPFNEQLIPQVQPETVQGFFEYQPEAQNPLSLTSSARQVYLSREFLRSDNFNQSQEFKSFAVLALNKYAQHKGLNIRQLTPLKDPIIVNFCGESVTFPRLDISSLCSPVPENSCQIRTTPEISNLIRNKIILIGFVSEKDDLDSLPIRSSFQDKMPAVEYQANILASLITGSYYKITPFWFQWLILILGAVAISGIICLKMTQQKKHSCWWILLFLGTVGGYSGLSLLFFYERLILPIVLPLSTWMVTGMSVSIGLRFRLQEDLIIQQQHEIEKLKLAEKEAILLQSRKLLHRIASDIHDGALQELKLVMDRIELNPIPDAEFMLSKLENIGQDIREQLNNIRRMGRSLEITPELRDGLAAGIRVKLQQLVDSGELTLNVIQEIQPLEEPYLDSSWIDAREDIYRFVREAIANIIRHAQPPYGTAIWVKISLFKQDSQCSLIIENNSAFELSSSGNRKPMLGGYGTKMLETIAAELPQGSWQRVTRPDGGMRVTLNWYLNFD